MNLDRPADPQTKLDHEQTQAHEHLHAQQPCFPCAGPDRLFRHRARCVQVLSGSFGIVRAACSMAWSSVQLVAGAVWWPAALLLRCV